jgi:stress-induced morphogen
MIMKLDRGSKTDKFPQIVVQGQRFTCLRDVAQRRSVMVTLNHQLTNSVYD